VSAVLSGVKLLVGRPCESDLLRGPRVLCLCNLSHVTQANRLLQRIRHCHAPLTVSLHAHATGSLVRGRPDGGEPGRRVRQDKDSHVTSNTTLLFRSVVWPSCMLHQSIMIHVWCVRVKFNTHVRITGFPFRSRSTLDTR
jgi:hypothetical protein